MFYKSIFAKFYAPYTTSEKRNPGLENRAWILRVFSLFKSDTNNLSNIDCKWVLRGVGCEYEGLTSNLGLKDLLGVGF